MSDLTARYIHIKGLVQGVGFRPFIYRLAVQNGLTGWVTNGNDGVRIHAEGNTIKINSFLSQISEKAPPVSLIDEINAIGTDPAGFDTFVIRESLDLSDEITDISPDIAVCEDCLEDMEQQPHRTDYPFVNCTNCGPRFTIVKDLPYDREKTTMAAFTMCDRCRKEYSDISDRRFHAQPVACNHCGPVYKLVIGRRVISDIHQIISHTSQLINEGKIVAIKGQGGFHLACDALNEMAVSRLRKRKYREGKPFAVMFGTLAHAREFFEISPVEEKTMLSWRRPIVILKNRPGGKVLAQGVSNGFNTTGTMLPYMPIHLMLFKVLQTPSIVLTSGNVSDEPIVIENEKAENGLQGIADAFLHYNRDIHNRSDDSVIFVAENSERVVRRSRGYVPTPQNLTMNTDGIFAAGAELVNCFCVGRGKQAILSQHIGDLQNIETLEFYQESFKRFCRMFRVNPSHIVTDLHPDYLSTRFALEYASEQGDLPLLKVQHHHAHIASCMAENRLSEPVIGISLDGVGLGTDGHIWGFEVMKADFARFERIAHLDYIPQPGGDASTREPWRMAVSYLNKYIGPDADFTLFPFYKKTGPEKVSLIGQVIRQGINSPLTSSAGRLFDAVAAMTGTCVYSGFHAEAPMRLENDIDPEEKGSYEMRVGSVIDPGPMICEIYDDIRKHVLPSSISAKFHRTIVRAIVNSAEFSRELTGLHKVALSGGVFQNRFLLENSIAHLQQRGFETYTQSLFPSNDGGIALGQIVVGAQKRSAGLF